MNFRFKIGSKVKIIGNIYSHSIKEGTIVTLKCNYANQYGEGYLVHELSCYITPFDFKLIEFTEECPIEKGEICDLCN